MSTNKITYISAINYVLKNYDLPQEIAEKIDQLKTSLEKKSGGERKPTANQEENTRLRLIIHDFIVNNADEAFTVSDLIKKIEELKTFSNQKVSALVNGLIPKDETGDIIKFTEKRKTYFKYNG